MFSYLYYFQDTPLQNYIIQLRSITLFSLEASAFCFQEMKKKQRKRKKEERRRKRGEKESPLSIL
jgi:hypothetical protein